VSRTIEKFEEGMDDHLEEMTHDVDEKNFGRLMCMIL